MKKIVLITVSLLGLPMLASAETRCGWISNPTPGNWWLTDRDASWTIMAQGSYEAEGMDLIGDISAGDYVMTNGNYGYGCACMDVVTDTSEERIQTINSFRQLPLSKCTKDKALGSPE
jgi:hypothetical protein